MSTRSTSSLEMPLRPAGSSIRTSSSESQPSTSDVTGWRSGSSQTFHTSSGSFTFKSDGSFEGYSPLSTDSRPMYNKAD
ncbi:hypothetical protein I203_101292 [Kwoniella mangroviensis CBS 8507]|uniref:uncharacterized protein n=1 Tax=Kwoniella mangroviensis CBS 8507 TaxID=1296122 RepID=UPI00080CEACC|nr:uncharacterized protein I203_02929 [Kwoniella mangroviensis CBS 8507]OCF68265.1 hypothetical protein I203_02929 [Kwoniella mangroviensis CBS 8507]